MLHDLLDINIPIFLALMVVCLLTGQQIGLRSSFFRRLIDEKLADPDREGHLEGLRGILAFGVFVHHAGYTWQDLNHGGWHAPESHFLVLLGGGSVAMFFFLTGYLFWSSFLRDSSGNFSTTRFYRKRLFRIGPAYWLFCCVMLTIVMLDAGGALRTTPREWLSSTAQWLAFGVPFGHFPDINAFEQTSLINAGVSWSLRHEVLFYLLLPLLLPFAKRRNTLILVGLLAATLVTFKWLDSLVSRTLTDTGQTTQLLHLVFREGLIEFNKFLVIGFAPGMLTAYALHRPGYRRLLDKVSTVHGVWMLVACLLLLLLNSNPDYSFLKVFPLWAIFFLIVARKVPLGVLRSRGLMVMGLASYSIYLFHGLFLFLLVLEPQGLDLYRAMGRPGIGIYWVLIAVVGLVTLAASALVYRFIEHPGMQFGKPNAQLAASGA